jgi:hypothetical protein
MGLFTGATAAATGPDKGVNDAPPLVRADYFIAGPPTIRLTGITETSRLPQGVMKAWKLYQVGEMHYVNFLDLDSRVQERSVDLRGDGERERMRFVRSPTRTGLTTSELEQRFGLLMTPSGEFKVSLDDAGRRTVMRRLETVWDDWRPASRAGLRTVYQVISDCGVPVGRGDLLMLLFADVPHETCNIEFQSVPPDPARDRSFLLIAPELESVFARAVIPQPTPGAAR